ncbi:MAG: uroporphyrinogen decarboxylase [Bdellovibrionota bacterium]
MKKNLLAAAMGEKTEKTPLWFMRQAGRYLPEYREIRSQHKTLAMFKNPKIASEITLQPLRRFSLDGAILYADILLIPDAMGLGLTFVEKEGPVFEKTIRCENDLQIIEQSTKNMDELISKLSYVGETVALVKPQLDPKVTMLGFAGAPFTVASYMIEGKSSKGEFFEAKKFMFQNANLFHKLMQHLTSTTIAYLKMQIHSGVEVVQLFESWSGAMNASFYKEFCFPYVKQIIDEIKKSVPVILFLGQGATLTEQVLELNPSVYSVDWRQDLAKVAKEFAGSNIALQGNLDPLLLYAPQALLKQKVEECLKVGRAYEHGYIFNLGHGFNQTTPIENVSLVVETVSK